jgi:hypothetical protein
MTALGADRDSSIVDVAATHASNHRPGRREISFDLSKLFALVRAAQFVQAERVDRANAKHNPSDQAESGGGN